MTTAVQRTVAAIIALLLSGCSEVSAPKVSSVAFDRQSALLWAGDNLATSVSVSRTDGTVVDNARVTYASSDERVATVDSAGRVYAHQAGQATISASVGSVADTLTVVVVWPPVTTLVFGHDSLVLAVGDTFQEPVIVLNARGNWATYAPLTFSSSDSSIATATEMGFGYFEGRIAAVREGRVTITVMAEHLTDAMTVIVR